MNKGLRLLSSLFSIIVTYGAFFGFVYVAVAFIVGSLDAMQWTTENRGGLIFVLVFSSPFYGMLVELTGGRKALADVLYEAYSDGDGA